mgnify:CR=1 FL=1
MEEEVITYQDRKDCVYDCMNAQKPGINPMRCGSGFVFDEEEFGEVNDLKLC